MKSYESVCGAGYRLRADQRADLIPEPRGSESDKRTLGQQARSRRMAGDWPRACATIAITTGYQVASSPASVSVGRVTARRASAGWASAANSSAPASATVPTPESAIIGL